jgi:hypothetical protein
MSLPRWRSPHLESRYVHTHAALNIYNRYFYTTKDCPNQAAIALGDTPTHALAAMGLASGHQD